MPRPEIISLPNAIPMAEEKGQRFVMIAEILIGGSILAGLCRLAASFPFVKQVTRSVLDG